MLEARSGIERKKEEDRERGREEAEEPLISKIVHEGSDVPRFITRCVARMGTRDERVSSSSRGSSPE